MEKMPVSRLRNAVFAAVAALGLAACGGQNLKPLESSAAPQAYRLGTGDRIAVNVFGEPTVAGEYEIDDTGNVSLPLAGRVNVRNMTPQEAEASMARRLSSALENPQVNVAVVRYRPFYILGEVQRPGAYSYYGGATVLNAVALAGGYTFRARTNQISVVRPEGSQEREPQLASEEAYLQPGDIVIVPPRWF